MINQVYAIKQRMHQEFIGGKRVPVTVLTVPEHLVIGKKTSEKDGYEAIILKLGKNKKVKEVKGIETEPEVEKALTAGSLVTVTGKSKGKGFAGVVKRWGFAGGPRTHGQSDRHRAPGSIARGTTPGRVVKGKRMAGHMGNVNVSVKNLKVLDYNHETGSLKLAGSVPGNPKSWVTIKITKPAS